MHFLTRILGLLVLCVLCLTTAPQKVYSQDSAPDQQLLHLKIYHFETDQQEHRLDDYLRNAYVPALHRMDHGPVGVFKPIGQDTTSDKRIYVLTSFDSFQQFSSLDDRLAKDKKYQRAGSSYINAAHDNPTFSEVEGILLRAYPYAPTLMESALSTPKTERVYELRSYESATEAQNLNKVQMFNEGGEVSLFDKLNFNAIFYGNVLVGSDMPNLMYMTSFANMESRDKHWDQFRNSPRWEEISSQEQYQNNVSHIDIHFLHPTEYSDL